MRIVVAVKEVPDTYEPRIIDLATGRADRGASEGIPDEIGERALEVALSYAETHADTQVVVLTMGPAHAAATVRKALAMGADEGIHILDDALAGSDLIRTAQVLASAIERCGFDLVITGNMSTDGSGGVMPAMLAGLLGVPDATALNEVSILDGTVRGRRLEEGMVRVLEAELPAVISITESLPDPRLPSFKGLMAAKKKPITTWSATDLGLSEDTAESSRSIVISASARPARVAGNVVIDEGRGGEQLVEFLVSRGLA